MANPNRRSSNSNSSSDGPRILSLVEWEVDVTTEVRNHLAQGFRGLYEDASESTAPSHSSSFSSSSQEHVSRILHAMKVPPALTICRLNFCRPERKDKAQVVKELQEQLQDWIRERYSTTTEHGPLQLRPETAVKVVITAHAVMDDVLCVEIRNEKEEQPQQQQQQQQTGRQNESLSLFHCRVPPPPDERVDDNDTDNGFEKPRLPPVPHQPPQQQNDWRRAAGWPLHHKVVITDRLCGEAVLRGADVFVRGVQCADANIVQGDVVAVYTDLVEKISKHPTTSASCSGAQRRLSRGLLLPHYRHPRTAVLVGVGVAACARATMFHSPSGLAVAMRQTAGPHLPPMHAILSPSRRRSSSDFILQNLPSIVVAHVLWPPPMVNGVVAVGASATTTTTAEDHDHDVVVLLDMCAAPGGKTSHLASLLQQDPRWATVTIVACDRSRHKMVQARQLFQRLGCDHTITSLALDTTHCVVRSEEGEPVPSVAEILAAADPSPKDGLLNVKGFYPQSFDHILLDPPCSALGLRPKLSILPQTVADLESFCTYQRQFIANAVVLLKPGGTMTYSTCTIHALENEGMVRHILDAYPSMQLVPIHIALGRPGLPGLGLNASECECVRRFDPSDIAADTIGFFVAKFQKAD